MKVVNKKTMQLIYLCVAKFDYILICFIRKEVKAVFFNKT